MPRLLFAKRENSLVNRLYRFGSITSIGMSIWKHSSKQQTPRQPILVLLSKDSLYAAARVARSMSISLVDHLHAMWNAIFDDVKR